jgi:hypothetical protein
VNGYGTLAAFAAMVCAVTGALLRHAGEQHVEFFFASFCLALVALVVEGKT